MADEKFVGKIMAAFKAWSFVGSSDEAERCLFSRRGGQEDGLRGEEAERAWLHAGVEKRTGNHFLVGCRVMSFDDLTMAGAGAVVADWIYKLWLFRR